MERKIEYLGMIELKVFFKKNYYRCFISHLLHRLEFVSNSDFTDSEFEKWMTVCSTAGLTLPTIDLIEQKQSAIKNAIQYEFKVLEL